MITHVVFITFVVLGIVGGLIYVIGLYKYDAELIKMNKKANLHPNSRILRSRPLVSILINTHGSGEQLQKCLTSVIKSNYRKYEISIYSPEPNKLADNIFTKFHNRYKSKNIRLIVEDHKNWQARAANSSGEYVLVIEDKDIIDKNAIYHAVRYFALNQKISALTINTRRVFDFSMISLVHQYEDVVKGQWRKVSSTIFSRDVEQSESFIVRRAALADKINGRYYSHVRTNTDSRTLRPTGALVIIILFPIFVCISYLIYLSIVYHYTSLLMIVWGAFSSFLVFSVWSDNYPSFSMRIRLTLLAPLAGLLFYAAIIKRLFMSALPQSVRHDPRMKLIG